MFNKNKSNDSDTSIGKVKADELLSTDGSDNEDLWREKNAEFFGPAEAPTEGLFKQMYEEYRGRNNQNKLREKCAEVYKIVPNTEQVEGNTRAEDAVKYCSMKLIFR